MEDQTQENPGQENAGSTSAEGGGEVLVVASKLKNYIRAKSGMNT